MTSSKIFGVATMPRVQRNGRYLAILFAFLMAAALYSFAQEATIVGTVTDPSGATIPNVTITATRVETGEVRTSVTNDTGQYVLPGLPIGHYTVKVQAAGFGPSEKSGIVLNVDDRSRVDFALRVGSKQEEITVEANAVQVQTESGEVSTVINGKQVAERGVN